MNKRPVTILYLAAMLFFCIGSQSCSSQQTTQTTVSRPDSSSYADSESSSYTTTTTTTNEPDSVLGATVHAIGTVVLFPFRLVGDAIGLLV